MYWYFGFVCFVCMFLKGKCKSVENLMWQICFVKVQSISFATTWFNMAHTRYKYRNHKCVIIIKNKRKRLKVIRQMRQIQCVNEMWGSLNLLCSFNLFCTCAYEAWGIFPYQLGNIFAKLSSSWQVQTLPVELRRALISLSVPSTRPALVLELYSTKLGQLA